MIRIDRNAVPPPESLTKPGGPGDNELQKAIADNFRKFAAYKGADVKDAIDALFNVKCAYCETEYGPGMPADIEHYRPKGAVVDDPSHPGYWWLAMKWDNLLASCIDCNRARGQVIITPGMTHEQVEAARRAAAARINTGKKDVFPVRGDRQKPQETNYQAEDPLIIDPTRCDPAAHLRYHLDNSDLPLVIAVMKPDGPDPYGATSIKVLGLNRLRLVQRRGKVLKKFRVQGQYIKDDLDAWEAATDPAAKAAALARAVDKWRELERWAEPTEEYSAMALAYIAALKDELGWDG